MNYRYGIMFLVRWFFFLGSIWFMNWISGDDIPGTEAFYFGKELCLFFVIYYGVWMGLDSFFGSINISVKSEEQ